MAESKVNSLALPKSGQDDVDEENRLPLEIEIHLQHVTAEENSPVEFQCLVTGKSPISSTWYRNGIELRNTPRMNSAKTNDWHKLLISSPTRYEQGVYTIVCRNETDYVMSQSTMFVKSPWTVSYPYCLGALYLQPSKVQVIKHLTNVKISTGDNLELEAHFKVLPNVKVQHSWFRNCETLAAGDAEISDRHVLVTKITIPNAQHNDSGVFCVVAYTQDGVASSMCEVFVNDIKCSGLEDISLPAFLLPLKEEVEVVLNEPVTLMCKLNSDFNVEVRWLKDKHEIIPDRRHKLKFFGNQRFGLQMPVVSLLDMGHYTVLVKSLNSGKAIKSTCFLNVTPPPALVPDTPVRIPLRTVVTSLGAKVCFHCGFRTKIEPFLYVVWYVGGYKVERSNSLFELITNQSDYLLYIKQVEPDMLGEVTCELRRFYPHQSSVLSARTTAHLVQVPTFLLKMFMSPEGPITAEKLYTEMNAEKSIAVWMAHDGGNMIEPDNERVLSSAYYGNSPQDLPPRNYFSYDFVNHVSRSQETVIAHDWYFKRDSVKKDDVIAGPSRRIVAQTPENPKEIHGVMMDVIYCRLQELSSNFLSLTHCDVKNSRINVSIDDVSVGDLKQISVKWEHIHNLPADSWYRIEMRQRDGSYLVAGETSSPHFYIREPTADNILYFRVTTFGAKEKLISSSLCIDPINSIHPSQLASNTEKERRNPLLDIKLDKYYELYVETKIVLGHGAFGEVVLVKDRNDNSFAAKIIKIRKTKRRDHAHSECYLMTKLCHPHIVSLQAGFVTDRLFIFVMDYLWGGELLERIIDEENFKEDIAVTYVKQILEALVYIHDLNIAHLDLKPENIVCTHPNSRQIKLIDFGLAREISPRSKVRGIYGTRDYVAPETLNFESLTTSSDMWSLGVVTYVMLSGVVPFHGEDWATRSTNIIKASYNYNEPSLLLLSDKARDFIDSLLVSDKNLRLNAREALEHLWVVDGGHTSAQIGRLHTWRSNLRAYISAHKARWQRVGNAVIAANRLRSILTPESIPTPSQTMLEEQSQSPPLFAG